MKITTDYLRDQNPKSIIYVDDQGLTPAYVKQAAYPTLETTKNVHDNVFAYPGSRLLPLHTKEATFLSAAYFYGEQVKDDLAECKIKRAAAAFEIEEDVHKVKDLFNQVLSKSASQTAATPYALTVEMSKSAGEQSFYPLGNAAELEASADQMSKDYHEGRLPLELYFDASRALVKAAKDLSVPSTKIPRSINQLGTPRVPDFEYATENLHLRKAAGYITAEQHDLYKEILQGASHEYDSLPTFSEKDEAMTKWAEAILEVDRMHGLDKLYGKQVKDAYSMLFSGPSYQEIEKAAGETLFVADQPLPLGALRAIPEKDISVRFTKPEAEKIHSWQKSASAFEVNRELALTDDGFQEELLRLAVKFG